jgi:16S rRNA (adenine1518-N6/adenine1519-N6)-dimethyltransferase
MNFTRKRFGQHWLRCDNTLAQIVQAGELSSEDHILEIGPGKGVLTRRLLEQVEKLVAVEIDRDLCVKLARGLNNRESFLLLEGDILSINLQERLKEFPSFYPLNKVIANIPYNITGPILEKLLGKIGQPNPNPYQSIVLLLQKEVAERITAQPSSKAYGALSVRVQYLAQAQWICNVPSSAFYPPPKVESAVIKLSPRIIESPSINPKQLETLLKLGFSSRRKMLRNNLKSLLDSTQIDQLLKQLNLNPQVRAEDLSLEKWINLSNLVN